MKRTGIYRKTGRNDVPESGIILLLTLFVVALLCVIVLEFSYTARVERHIAYNYRDETLAFNIAKAGIFETIALLREDRLEEIEEKELEEETSETEKEDTVQKLQRQRQKKQKDKQAPKDIEFPDHYGESWAQERVMEPFGEGLLSVKVIDETGKINVNRIVKEILPVEPKKKKVDSENEEEEEDQEKIKLPRKWGQKDEDETGEESQEATEPTEEEEEYEKPARYTVDSNTQKVIMRLLETIDARGVDSEDVTNAIIDWMDSNDDGDWEDDSYKDSVPKNAPLELLSELLLIKGVTPDLYFGEKREETERLEDQLSRRGKRKRGKAGLRDTLTVHSEAKVNVNTAPPEVLAALMQEENEALVKEVTSYTKKKYFKDLKEFQKEIGEHIPASMITKIGVGSDAFQIISEGRVNDTVKRIRAVVQRDEEANVRILFWRIEE